MLKELVINNRSYRGFDETYSVSKEQLLAMVECARLTPSTVNKQPLKYYIAYKKEIVDTIQPLTRWAKALSCELPYVGHCPSAFIIICQDIAISPALDSFLKDVGIVAQTIMLCATEMKLGGCMIGSFDKEKVHETLHLPKHIHPMLVLAIGKPEETIVLEDMKEHESSMYYRDEQDVHHVPKRMLKDIVIMED